MAIAGANGRQDVCGGGIERAARVRVETDAPCGAASAPLAQLAAARVGHVLYLEEKILASRISNGNNVKKITRERREASGAASSRAATRSLSFRAASLLLPSCLSKTVYGGKGGRGGVSATQLRRNAARTLWTFCSRPTLSHIPLIGVGSPVG